MPNLASFSGPLAASYDRARPLALVLTGTEQAAVATGLILSFDVTADPGLPPDLTDAVLVGPSDVQGGQYLLQTVAGEYRFAARRMFLHRDLSALMRDVVPPQSVSLAYRLRWRLGIFLARLPLLRSWLLARAAKN